MIHSERGFTRIKGKGTHVLSEMMCIIERIVVISLIPEKGSKENARKVLDKMIDEVFEHIND